MDAVSLLLMLAHPTADMRHETRDMAPWMMEECIVGAILVLVLVLVFVFVSVLISRTRQSGSASHPVRPCLRIAWPSYRMGLASCHVKATR